MAKEKITQNDPHRAELAAAIADAEAARKRLEIARTAAANAETHLYEAHGKLEELRKLAPENGSSPDRLLESLAAAGSNFEGSALEVPEEAARRAEAKVENDIVSWRRAHKIAEQAIPGRQAAVDCAGREVEKAARAVIGSSCDVGKLVADAEIAAAAIIDQRSRLMNLRTHLDGDANAAVDNFLARPWLLHEMNGEWMNHPAAAQYRDAHAALMLDATAPLPE
jgi:hypothetical protein